MPVTANGHNYKHNNTMLRINHLLVATAAAVMLCLAGSDAAAQNNQNPGGQRQGGGRQRQGNFDPAQMQQRMMDRYKERLEVTDDNEWKALQPLIQKVMDARMAMGTGGGRGAFAPGGRRGGGDNNNQANATQRRGPAQANPTAEELQKAVDNKVPASELKAALNKYLDSRKSKRADLEKAQDALRAVLTARQEAIAVLAGLL
jgi:hypothetical protein